MPKGGQAVGRQAEYSGPSSPYQYKPCRSTPDSACGQCTWRVRTTTATFSVTDLIHRDEISTAPSRRRDQEIGGSSAESWVSRRTPNSAIDGRACGIRPEGRSSPMANTLQGKRI